MGTAARLNAIAEALASLPLPNASPPARETPSASLARSSQRLRDTDKEQNPWQMPVVLPRLPFSCITNAQQAAPLTASQRDRTQRLKDIQEGLAAATLVGNEKQPEGWRFSNYSGQKRPLSSQAASETEPPTKRHKSSEHVQLPCTYPAVNNQGMSQSGLYPLTAPPAVTMISATPEFEVLSDENKPFQSNGGNNFVARFFAGYPAFHYDASASIWEQLHRMGKVLQWDKQAKEDARTKLRDALTRQFNSMAGNEKQPEGRRFSNHSGQKRSSSSQAASERELPTKRHKSSEHVQLPCTYPAVSNHGMSQSGSYHLTAPSAVTVISATPKFEVLSEEVKPFQPNGGNNFVASFFAGYPGFHYNTSASVWDQFYRMKGVLQWDKQAKEDARTKLRDALTRQFNSMYGTDVNDIKNWQLLCRVLGITPVPQSLFECHQVVLNTHVNLVDLTTYSADNPVWLFETERELSMYTRASQKYFPRNNIHEGGLLKFLLRDILRPSSRVRTA